MKTYRVKWEIDIEATGPYHAAMEALSIQRDPNSIATVFEIDGKVIEISKAKPYEHETSQDQSSR